MTTEFSKELLLMLKNKEDFIVKKKVLSLFLVLLVLSFSACGKTVEKVPENTSETATEQVADTSEEQLVTSEEQVETSEEQSDSQKGVPDDFVAEASGVCGADLTWEYGNSILYIHGTGDMIDYDVDNNDIYAPWYENYQDKIAKIIIEDGCTSIGNFAFSYLPIVVSVEIPSSVKRIGYGAFYSPGGGDYTNQMTSITIPDGVETIEGKAFASCPLESIEIPDSVTNMVECPIGDPYGCSIKSFKMPKKLGNISLYSYAYFDFDELILPDDFDAIYTQFSGDLLAKVFDPSHIGFIDVSKTVVWRGKTYSSDEIDIFINDLTDAGILNQDPGETINRKDHYNGTGQLYYEDLYNYYR